MSCDNYYEYQNLTYSIHISDSYNWEAYSYMLYYIWTCLAKSIVLGD